MVYISFTVTNKHNVISIPTNHDFNIIKIIYKLICMAMDGLN